MERNFHNQGLPQVQSYVPQDFSSEYDVVDHQIARQKYTIPISQNRFVPRRESNFQQDNRSDGKKIWNKSSNFNRNNFNNRNNFQNQNNWEIVGKGQDQYSKRTNDKKFVKQYNSQNPDISGKELVLQNLKYYNDDFKTFAEKILKSLDKLSKTEINEFYKMITTCSLHELFTNPLTAQIIKEKFITKTRKIGNHPYLHSAIWPRWQTDSKRVKFFKRTQEDIIEMIKVLCKTNTTPFEINNQSETVITSLYYAYERKIVTKTTYETIYDLFTVKNDDINGEYNDMFNRMYREICNKISPDLLTTNKFSEEKKKKICSSIYWAIINDTRGFCESLFQNITMYSNTNMHFNKPLSDQIKTIIQVLKKGVPKLNDQKTYDFKFYLENKEIKINELITKFKTELCKVVNDFINSLEEYKLFLETGKQLEIGDKNYIKMCTLGSILGEISNIAQVEDFFEKIHEFCITSGLCCINHYNTINKSLSDKLIEKLKYYVKTSDKGLIRMSIREIFKNLNIKFDNPSKLNSSPVQEVKNELDENFDQKDELDEKFDQKNSFGDLDEFELKYDKICQNNKIKINKSFLNTDLKTNMDEVLTTTVEQIIQLFEGDSRSISESFVIIFLTSMFSNIYSDLHLTNLEHFLKLLIKKLKTENISYEKIKVNFDFLNRVIVLSGQDDQPFYNEKNIRRIEKILTQLED